MSAKQSQLLSKYLSTSLHSVSQKIELKKEPVKLHLHGKNTKLANLLPHKKILKK